MSAQPGQLALAAATWLILASAAGAVRGGEMRVYQTRYYVIHTDLGAEVVREAAVRMAAMAEEYHRRTRDFEGTIDRKLPFYIFSDPDAFRRAGGLPGSTGAYTGQWLMTLAADGRVNWPAVQHEGFHQFVSAVIGGPMPIWANEGMAEYFGMAQFTGDGFVVGLIPPARLRGCGRPLPTAASCRCGSSWP